LENKLNTRIEDEFEFEDEDDVGTFTRRRAEVGACFSPPIALDPSVEFLPKSSQVHPVRCF
jgi:hypothetical protein